MVLASGQVGLMYWGTEAGLGGLMKSRAPSSKYSTLLCGDGQDHCKRRVPAFQESGELSRTPSQPWKKKEDHLKDTELTKEAFDEFTISLDLVRSRVQRRKPRLSASVSRCGP